MKKKLETGTGCLFFNQSLDEFFWFLQMDVKTGWRQMETWQYKESFACHEDEGHQKEKYKMGECVTEVSSTEGHNKVKMQTVDPLTDFGCLGWCGSEIVAVGRSPVCFPLTLESKHPQTSMWGRAGSPKDICQYLTAATNLSCCTKATPTDPESALEQSSMCWF